MIDFFGCNHEKSKESYQLPKAIGATGLRSLAGTAIARLAEIRRAGITPAAVSRLEREGSVVRLSRGLYQLTESNHSLAEVAKRVPKGVICLVSALAFHGVTDQMPRRVWTAIGSRDWKPLGEYPPLHIVRFADKYLHDDVMRHDIEGVSVPVFGVAKTIADTFRHRRSVGTDVAVCAQREALHQRKATPAEISASSGLISKSSRSMNSRSLFERHARRIGSPRRASTLAR